MINDLRNWPRWSAWSERDRIEFSYGDTVEGVGALQRWRHGKNHGSLKIVRSEPGRRIDYSVKLGGEKLELLGRIDVVPDGACTRITWKSVWEPARNPYMRYVDLFFRWRMRRDFAYGLARLKALVEGKAVPTPRTA